MSDVSLLRLYLLRALYLTIAVGLGSGIWPIIVKHANVWPMMHGVALCLLAALCSLAWLGLRYPLQMLPLLFFELLWKALWIGVVAVPLWRAGTMDRDNWDTAYACLPIVIALFFIPWQYVFAYYMRKPGDRWR
jgi:hypothetical protein